MLQVSQPSLFRRALDAVFERPRPRLRPRGIHKRACQCTVRSIVDCGFGISEWHPHLRPGLAYSPCSQLLLDLSAAAQLGLLLPRENSTDRIVTHYFPLPLNRPRASASPTNSKQPKVS